jgi:hypothetical protein
VRARDEYQPMSDAEWARMTCEHEWGEWDERTPFGCTRSCRRCGQKMCDPNHCGQWAARKPKKGDAVE